MALQVVALSPLSDGKLDNPVKCFAQGYGKPARCEEKDLIQSRFFGQCDSRELPTPNIISSQRLVSVFRARQELMLMLITHCY